MQGERTSSSAVRFVAVKMRTWKKDRNTYYVPISVRYFISDTYRGVIGCA